MFQLLMWPKHWAASAVLALDAVRQSLRRPSKLLCKTIGYFSALEYLLVPELAYYLALILASVGITRASDQAAINVSLQIWNFLLVSWDAVASERCGRRFLWLLSSAAMLISLSTTTMLSGLLAEKHLAAAGIAVVLMLFLFMVLLISPMDHCTLHTR